MKQLALPGRILFLSADPARIAAQLAGEDLAPDATLRLRDDVSTDEISPITVMTHYDERLGRYPYVGLKAGDARPIGTDAVRNGGFGVTVAGKRYGKGSSREHSPVAEREAGIRLVIAESFERIYRQNADNVGLFTSHWPRRSCARADCSNTGKRACMSFPRRREPSVVRKLRTRHSTRHRTPASAGITASP